MHHYLEALAFIFMYMWFILIKNCIIGDSLKIARKCQVGISRIKVLILNAPRTLVGISFSSVTTRYWIEDIRSHSV